MMRIVIKRVEVKAEVKVEVEVIVEVKMKMKKIASLALVQAQGLDQEELIKLFII